MPVIHRLTTIKDVCTVELEPFSDTRGRFLETFRKEWFPQRNWDVVQSNRSDSRAGVLRGLHYHFHQVDYWYVIRGKIRVGLADIRPDSPTAGAVETIEMGGGVHEGLFVPIGVAHGFLALTDATLTYIVDNYYDSQDEYGIAWNDPQLNVPWGTDSPILSARDARNPLLRDIPAEQRPQRHLNIL
jgi:dTDP-4-dehydrorhamnose 3,5-epimerase